MYPLVSTNLGKAARLVASVAALAALSAAQTPSLSTLYSFAGGANGANPGAGVVFGANGSLFGTTPYGGTGTACQGGCGTIFEVTPGTPWTQTVLYNFQGGADGANPGAALTVGTGGVFYGTTFGGGATGNGTVFRLNPPSKAGGAWTETVLYSFQTTAGGTVNVSGTAVSLVSGTPFVTGSAWAGASINIAGVNYTIAGVASSSALTLTTAAGTETAANYVVSSAAAGPWAGWPDGGNPQGGVVLLTNGKMYGTTSGGGTAGAGAVFQLTPPKGAGAWTEKVIYNFLGGKDGSGPQSGLVVSNGDLFGNTCCGTVGGTVFKLAQAKGGTWSKAEVYSFTSFSTGQAPVGGLAVDANGVLYGTTIEGGADGAGIVFSLTPGVKGKPYTLKTIHTFTNGTDGGAPYGGLLLGASGVVYATVTVGCSFGAGGVLEFAPPAGGTGPWTETVLYNFTGGADGAQPYGGVVLNNNSLFGTTAFSNDGTGYGTVFQLTL
jgi:uncharacterized repeat protein (TIGR03803 family)